MKQFVLIQLKTVQFSVSKYLCGLDVCYRFHTIQKDVTSYTCISFKLADVFAQGQGFTVFITSLSDEKVSY